MTTITAQTDTTEGAVTTPEGAANTEFAATTEFEVEAATRQVDTAANTTAVFPQLPEQGADQAQGRDQGRDLGGQQLPSQVQPQTPQGPAFAITSFVLGLASIVSGWMFFAPVVGLILGILALRRGTPERGLALWGVWLNGVMLALSLIGVVVFGALLGAGIFVLPILAA